MARTRNRPTKFFLAFTICVSTMWLARPVAALNVNLDPNSVAPRTLTPYWSKEVFQSSPDGRPLPVRMDSASFTAAGMGAMVPTFRFAVQYAVQRWNEVGAVAPRLEWQNSEGVNYGQAGVINVYMVSGPRSSAGEGNT